MDLTTILRNSETAAQDVLENWCCFLVICPVSVCVYIYVYLCVCVCTERQHHTGLKRWYWFLSRLWVSTCCSIDSKKKLISIAVNIFKPQSLRTTFSSLQYINKIYIHTIFCHLVNSAASVAILVALLISSTFWALQRDWLTTHLHPPSIHLLLPPFYFWRLLLAKCTLSFSLFIVYIVSS